MTLIQELADELVTLCNAIEESAAENSETNSQSVEAMRERLSTISREAMQAPASTETELVWKARILLKWLDPDGDWRDDFATYLCRDILRMYGEKAPACPLPCPKD